MSIRFISLFSGIEAASAAWLPLGWECVAVAEIEPFPCAVLKHHYPDVPNLGDITKITQEQIESLGHIDIVVGGFPCQDLSVAGKRKGLKNEDGTNTRSGLFYDAMRIVRWSNARFVLLENVPGIYSSNSGRDFASMVGEILGIEFDVPRDGWENSGIAASERGLLEWATLDAQFFGVPQRRRRMFALADFGDWRSRGPILFERHSLQGNPAPSRQTGQGFAAATSPSLTASGRGVPRPGESRGQDPVIAVASPVSRSVERPRGDGLDTLISHSLRGEGFDASEDGTGRGTPLVPVIGTMCMATGQAGAEIGAEISPTLNCNHEAPIAFQSSQSGVRLDDVHATLDSNNGSRRHNGVLAFDCKSSGQNGFGVGEIASTLRSMGHSNSHQNGGVHQAIATGMQVRRLTPRECERLQGFKDDYTLIQMRGKPAADGPRYKALGNSMAVPVMAWIGLRIDAVSKLEIAA